MASRKGAHGPYSSKLSFPKGQDFGVIPLTQEQKDAGMIKPPPIAMGFISHPLDYTKADPMPRTAFKGTQMMVKAERIPLTEDGGPDAPTRYAGKRETFAPLTYAPEEYVDRRKKVEDHFKGDTDPDKRKAAFCSTSTLGREEMAPTVEVERYRHQLRLEKRGMDKHPIVIPEDLAASVAAAGGGGGTIGPGGPLAKSGLMSTIPRFASEFDRVRHVEEFSTRRYAPDVKFTREHGSMKPVSADIGEGCDVAERLVSPPRGIKKPMTHSIAHPAVPILNATLH